MGEVWERQIRTARRILNTLLREHGSHLDDESLQTLMCVVESINKSRPLTVMSSDVKDPYPSITKPDPDNEDKHCPATAWQVPTQ